MNDVKQDRLSNFELLRILAMFGITIHHFCVHGNFVLPSLYHFNTILIQVCASFGKLGVNLFILITGYFMIKSNFKIKSFLKLFFEVLFYSLSILIVFKIFHIDTIIDWHINTYLYPIGGGAYWFFTTYMVLYILSPFINILLKNLDKYKHFFLIVLLITLWSILPNLIANVDYCFSALGWFITLYIIAAYIRLYPQKIFDNQKQNILIVCASFLIVVLFFFIADFRHKYPLIPFISTMNSIVMLVASVSILLCFKNWKIKYNKGINWVAASVFSVYLISDNNFVRPFLWKNIFKTASLLNSHYLIFYIFYDCFIIFLVSILIDKIRIYILEKNLLIIVDKILFKLSPYFNRKLAKLFPGQQNANRLN